MTTIYDRVRVGGLFRDICWAVTLRGVMRKFIGYTLLAISCLAFALLPVIPFLDQETATKASWAGALFIFAEVCWWLAMPFLGKEVIAFCQRYWQLAKIRLRLGKKASEADLQPANDPKI